jgi:catechol 2,3-dioxygenase-like lactoylglutathione lyase family enzyme
MTIDHVGVDVADFAASRRFYAAALAPLGITVMKEHEGWVLFGRDGEPAFSFAARGGIAGRAGPIHLAFAADTREQVRAFHAAALAAGGRDNGAPGLRPQYHPDYYGAFAFDPDGHNIEAVCHAAEG